MTTNKIREILARMNHAEQAKDAIAAYTAWYRMYAHVNTGELMQEAITEFLKMVDRFPELRGCNEPLSK